MRLADAAGIALSEEKADFLRELSAYYIQTRYPEEVAELSRKISESQAKDIYLKTGEIITWLNSLLK